jgi:hypothetical protein
MTQGQAFLLPPSSDKCQICAVSHEPEQPHNQQSFYYQTRFNIENKRVATWHDAMAHCTDKIKQQWLTALKEKGVDLPDLTV